MILFEKIFFIFGKEYVTNFNYTQKRQGCTALCPSDRTTIQIVTMSHVHSVFCFNVSMFPSLLFNVTLLRHTVEI